MVTFDAAEPGTSRRTWERDTRLADAPVFDLSGFPAMVVLAAHPDDETLGAGGLIARCREAGVAVRVICVTDGAASHAELPDLAETRRRELQQAIHVLHPEATLDWFGFADGRTEEQYAEISAAIRAALDAAPADALVVAPWRGDGHPDHRVVGELAVQHAADRAVLEYPIWMWHWASPDHAETPWDRLVAVPIDADVKQRAIASFASQIEVPVEAAGAPVLRDDFLEHFRRPVEHFATTAAEFGREYFDALYTRSDDPWSFRTRWYESRKRALTVASLTRERFRSGLEIGCSVGHLSELLAERCDALLAVDISERAIAEARRTARAGVEFAVHDVRDDLPGGRFDLVVLSEVAYYWDEAELRAIRSRIRRALAPDGILVACHWRHPVAAHRLSGDRVHEILQEEEGWARVVAHVEEDFVLEVYAFDGGSVARAEGLA
ncbi:PIG-L family deacetylase [Leucobacter chromiiresistens]